MRYRDVWINQGLDPEGADPAHPVMALASRQMRHSLFVEVTPGPDIHPGRLERYGRMTAVELRRATRLAREQTETYGVAVFGREEHRDALRARVEESETRPALILCTPEGLVLDANPFVKAALTGVFQPLLAVDLATLPMSWIPFDHASPPVEIAAAVVPEVVRRLLHGEPRIELGDICGRQTLWGITTEAGRRMLWSSVRDVLVDAASREMRAYFSLRGNVVEAVMTEARESGLSAPGEGRRSLNLRTLRIASIRLTQLMERLRNQDSHRDSAEPATDPIAQPAGDPTEVPSAVAVADQAIDPEADPAADPVVDQAVDFDGPGSSSTSTRASSDGSR